MYQKENPETIQELFNAIAKQYDRVNGVLSLQLHRYWNSKLVNSLLRKRESETILDLCCGTGEIAFRFLQKSHRPCEAYLLDFSEEMLLCGEEKAKKCKLQTHQIHYLQADAQEIPLPDSSVDCITMAYGIRNIKDPLRCAKEAFRVLRPGGYFGILELTQPANVLLRMGHQLYLKTAVPLLGKWLTSNQ
jgi:demethylmenaquinone methyltransferase / 2-methoxy-6-polyprenyl-1,4-benzoquinol methylase